MNISCKSSGEVSPPLDGKSVIATFADQKITLDDLKANFYRNRNPEQTDSSEFREFFPSYIDYRLKLYEGRRQGYHQDSTILAEFNEYVSEIAYRYWIENDIKEERINTFKNRFEVELKAFHILREVSQDALPKDTAGVYITLVGVRDALLNGASPEEMNERYSTKRNGNPVGGHLSWITAGSTLQPFENAAYSLEPGEISMPVRTQFGYHLIILQDVRPRTPQRLVKHIFVRRNKEETGSQKIQQAYEALESGRPWSDVLQEYTEDPSTENQDGLLGWVGYGMRYPFELIESAMSANAESAYSPPFKVSYGYHIMKIDSIRTFENDEQKEEFIVNRLEQLDRLDPEIEDVLKKIANESGMEINRSNFAGLAGQSGPSGDANGLSQQTELIRFNGKIYTSEHFQEWLNRDSTGDEVMESGDIVTTYRNYIIKNDLVEYTKNRFPGFARQADHFMNDLIVFKVNEEYLWNPDFVDPIELKKYYQSNQSRYKHEKTFVYTEISAAASDSLIDVIYRKLMSGADAIKLAESMNDVTIIKESTDNSQHPVSLTLETLQKGEFSKPVSVDDREIIYILNDIQNERLLTFDEAFNMVFSDYQHIHEKRYIHHLKEQYNLVLYPEKIQ